ncbi:MAG: hypothetical protein ACTSVO_12015 [Candidatus Heimdallarchaeaceae archaeon]
MASVNLFGRTRWLLADVYYVALLAQLAAIGFFCAFFAVSNIVLSLVFRRNKYIFVILSFLITIFGSFQFIVFTISPFGVADKINAGLIVHFQYIISFVLSLITLAMEYLYVISSRNMNNRSCFI